MCISDKWPTALHRLSPPPASGRPRRRARAAPNAGIDAARVLSGDVDAIIIDVAGREVAKCKTPVAIFATGGFGRGELAPFSDLDLLVLCAKTPGNDVQKLAEAILYPLWDAKVDAGHAVRAYDQALALPANDLAAATALLDARFLTGDRALADKFLAAFRARVAKTAAEDFVARLRAEQKERHSRFGDTIFLLEPDLKNGPGGLRDLCVGRWAAMARFGTSDPKQLLAQGVMTGRLAQAFTAATEWLMRVRILMHATAGRRQDHLRFALQEAIAPILYPEARDRGGVIRPAVHPAVEALMHQYHAHAKLIRNETERLLQRATVREDKRRKTQPVMVLGDRLGGKTADAHFVVRDGALEPIDPGIFERKPSEIIRIFQLAIDLDVPLALRTREQLGELAASQPGVAARGRGGGPALRRAAAATRAIAPTRRAWNRCRTSASSPRSCPSGSRRRAACSTTSITCTPSTSTRCTRSGGCTRSSAAITRRCFRFRPRRSPRSRVRSRWRSGRCCTTWASRTAARTARSARAWRWRSAAGWESRRRTRSGSSSWCASTWSWARCRSGAIWRTWG